MTAHEYPRIRNLPEAEQEPFRSFLNGQTVPWVDGVPVEEQDFYYECDYENWKRKPQNRFWD